MNRSTCFAFMASLLVAASWYVPRPIQAEDRSLLNARLPVGTIGQTQVQRRPELANVWQPTLIRVPDGATLSLAEGSGFVTSGQRDANLVSLQVGQPYRLKVSQIPNQFGDVYPTIELVDRLHPPTGKETRYPVPVQITAEELAMALSGKFVTRVIYVEDPRNAVGARDLPEQRYFEALPDEDPYEVASRIGRPIAILRMGSVLPTKNLASFLFGSPAWKQHGLWPKQPTYQPSDLEPSDLPVEPQKRAPLPSTPALDTTNDRPPTVSDNLPEKKEIEDQPDDLTLEEDGVDEGGGEAGDEPGFEEATSDESDTTADDFFDDAAPTSDDPFAEFE